MIYRRPVDALALLAVLALLLCGLQYFTISKFSALDSAGYISLGHFLDALSEKIRFDGVDAALGFGAGAVLLALVALEVFRGRITTLLGWVCASERRAMLAVVLTGAVAVRYFLTS